MQLKPYIYGTWLLRTTNDININDKFNYIIINDENTIKFKSLDYDQIFGIKKSRTANIISAIPYENHSYNISLQYSKKNTYTYSFLNIEIPELKTKSENYMKEKNITIELHNSNVLFINDTNLSLYYIFDLYVHKNKYPNIETSLNSFLFTQIFGIITGIIINQIFTTRH